MERFKGSEKNIFIACWLIYFATYICRLNFSAVLPQLSIQGVFTDIQLAMISSVFFITYGVGQLINGILGDKMRAEVMMISGLCITGACNILIFFFHSYNIFVMLWLINGFGQAMIWPPIIKIAGKYYEEEKRVKFCTDIATTVPLGTLAGYGVSLLVMQFAPWQYVFLTCGLIVITVAVVMNFVLNSSIKQIKVCQISENKSDIKESKTTFLAFLKMLLPSGLIILFIPIAMHGLLKDGVMSWVPKYISDTFSLSASFSLSLTLFLPIVNVLGAYIAKWINKKIKSELAVSAMLFGVAIVALLVLLFFGKISVVINVICLACVTTSMFAINYLFISILPLYFSKFNRASSMSGLLNSVAYIGAGVSNIFVGVLLGVSWTAVIIFWIGMAVLSVILALLTSILWKKFTKQNNL